ncbi:NuA4-domain-containing protein [Cylindrobasidium torrendii FP15055 ss-10]|uniref:Chromatin modification-related protein EAF6 n=1 Tax=Cylindrobasidium torrendii FP15055 ss-10 TaxID=1314674 RepID=A0A0D7BM51_9AGAR|nr:NuA4-domain-containing protein [Cylindrobasidium torrendii FP15055 ss-10]
MATDAPPASDDKTRYEVLKKELKTALSQKRKMDQQLAQVESEIYKLEGAYLQDTMNSSGGNIVSGFDNFFKNQSNQRRKTEVNDADRVFSNSSVTIQRSLEINGDVDDDEHVRGSGPTTVTLRPSTSHENKLIRDREYARRKRAHQRAATAELTTDSESVVSAPTPAPVGRPRKRARVEND